jgi:hypothetical protein
MHQPQAHCGPTARRTPARFHVWRRALGSDLVLLALCSITASLALVFLWKGNDDWVYSKIGYLDTWMYVGYGLYWGDPAVMPGNYKASRLPWILYEFLHYHLFRPEVGVPIVQFGCYLWLLIGNYLFTRRLFDPLVAGLTSVALVLWTHMHGNGGADYHNTLSGPLFVWCAYTTVRPMQDRAAAPWFVIPGGLYLALIVTNPLYLNLSLAFAALGLFAWRQPQKDIRYLLSCTFWATVGMAAAFVMLGLINMRFGRPFIFTTQIFGMTKFLLVQGGNVWWKGWGSWVLEQRSAYLGPLGAMLIIAGVELTLLLRRKHWDSTHRGAVLVHGIYIFHALLWILWQSVGQTTLDFFYFAYPLWVLWCWSLAAVLAVRLPSFAARASLPIGAMAIIIITALTVVALLFGSSLHAFALRQTHYMVVQAGLIVLAFYLVLVGAAFVRAGAVIVTFALFYPAVDLLSQGWVQEHELIACNYGGDGFHTMIDTFRFIRGHVSVPYHALVWVDEGENVPNQPDCPRNIDYSILGNIFGNAVFTSFGPSWPIRPVDAIPDDDIAKASDSRYVIAIFTSTPGNVEKIRGWFAQQGVPMNLIDHRYFNSQTIAYSVYLLRAADPPDWPPGAPGIHIVEAAYGSNCEDYKVPPPGENFFRPGNATSAVARFCAWRHQRCDFTVKAGRLGDPVPSCEKDFVVKWFCGGQPGTHEARLEGEANGHTISIICPRS